MNIDFDWTPYLDTRVEHFKINDKEKNIKIEFYLFYN